MICNTLKDSLLISGEPPYWYDMQENEMINPHIKGSLLLVFCFMLALESTASADDAPGKRAKSKPVVIVRPGESSTVCLSWNDDTGRVPVIFISDRPNLTDKAKSDFDGKRRWESEGLVAEYDEEGSARVQKLINESSLSTVKEHGGSQGKTVAVIRVSADHRVQKSVRSLFVHIVSGTGRNMLLNAEFYVTVLDR